VVEVELVGLSHLYLYPNVVEVGFGASVFLHQYPQRFPDFVWYDFRGP